MSCSLNQSSLAGSYLLGGNGSFIYKNPGLDCTWVRERVLTTNARPCMRNVHMSSSKCRRLGICDCIATGFVMIVRQPLFVLMLFTPVSPDGFMRIQTQLYDYTQICRENFYKWGPDEHRNWCLPCPADSYSSGSTSACICADGKYMRILVRFPCVCGGARERVVGSYPSPISVGRSATVEKLCRPLCIHFCFKNVLQVQTDAEYLTKTHVQALCSEQALDPPDSLECCPATCDADVCPQCWLPFMQPYSVPRCPT